jgi:hypothetical protein
MLFIDISFGNARIHAPWGLKPSVVLWFYTAIVRPSSSFSCHVWWYKATRRKIRKTLDKLQRMACLAITTAMRTTHTESLQMLLNLPPLHIYVQTEPKRTRALNTRLAIDGHSNILDMMVRDLPILEASCDLVLPTLNVRQKISVASLSFCCTSM